MVNQVKVVGIFEGNEQDLPSSCVLCSSIDVRMVSDLAPGVSVGFCDNHKMSINELDFRAKLALGLLR